MNERTRQTAITIIRRVRLREDLKPIRCLGESKGPGPDWLTIAHVTDNKGYESFDCVFLRSDGVPFPWMGFETLMIAKDQAHAMVGVEYVEWEPCNIVVTGADQSVSWERALPGDPATGVCTATSC